MQQEHKFSAAIKEVFEEVWSGIEEASEGWNRKMRMIGCQEHSRWTSIGKNLECQVNY